MVKSRKHQTKIVGVTDFHVFLVARKVNGLEFFLFFCLFGSCRISFSFVCKCRNVASILEAIASRLPNCRPLNETQSGQSNCVHQESQSPNTLYTHTTCASRIVSRGKVNELTVAQSGPPAASWLLIPYKANGMLYCVCDIDVDQEIRVICIFRDA